MKLDRGSRDAMSQVTPTLSPKCRLASSKNVRKCHIGALPLLLGVNWTSLPRHSVRPSPKSRGFTAESGGDKVVIVPVKVPECDLRTMTLTFAQHLTETLVSRFEIAGTFLLAVEAIKLENLQMVRLKWVRDRFLWAISPRIWITRKDTHEEVKAKGQKAFNRIAVIIFLVGSMAGYGMLRSMGHSMSDVYHGIAAGISGPTWFSNSAAALLTPTLIFGVSYFAVGLLYCAALAGCGKSVFQRENPLKVQSGRT